MITFYALMFLGLSGSTLAQITGLGSCPFVAGQENFNSTQFTDKWYEWSRYFALFEADGICSIQNYEPTSQGTINATNHFISRLIGQPRFAQAELKPDGEDPSKMTGKLPSTPFNAISDCWILGTDYDNYGVVYCCTNMNFINLKWAWILTRERIPNNQTIAKAYEVIDKNNVSRQYFSQTKQDGCSN